MTYRDWEKSVEKGPAHVTVRLILLTGFVSFVGFIVFGGLYMLTNPLTQASRIVNKTIDADNVIYNYEWFKQRNEDVLSIDNKIVAMILEVEKFKEEAGERNGWHREDREEYSRLNSIKVGLEQQRNDLVAEYNARSKMVNRSIFKDGVPERIE